MKLASLSSFIHWARFDGHEFVELLPEDFTRDEYETLLQEFQVPAIEDHTRDFNDFLSELSSPPRTDLERRFCRR